MKGELALLSPFGWPAELTKQACCRSEGAPVTPFAAGVPKTAAHPNAARLFLNWCLSDEGQAYMIKELGNFTSLKKAKT